MKRTGERHGVRHAAALALVAVVAALASDRAGAVSAANSATFIDAAFDHQGGAPDVTTVTTSNDDEGMLEFRLHIRNRSDLTDGDAVSVNLDVDQSAATGCDIGAGVGLDWVLFFAGHTAPVPDSYLLLRFQGCESDGNVPQRSFVASFDAATSTLVLRVDRAELGDARAFRIIVIANVNPVGPATWDLGGDLAPWIYEVLVSPPRDTAPPQVRALAGSARRGKVASLRYSVFDDSGEAREEITVLQGRRTLVRLRSSVGRREVARVYVRRWRVPAGVRGPLRFCVRAWDAAGNASVPSCARLALR